jgi:hypothetical protein
MSVALARLMHNLRVTFTAEISADCPSPDRARQALALRFLTEYLQSEGLERNYCVEIMKLGNSLRDLDNGKVPPLLKPYIVKHRAPDTTDIWLGRALVALVFEALTWSGPTPTKHRRKGLTREAAMLFISMRESHIAHLMTPKAQNAGTAAAHWHWQLKEGLAGSAIALEVFSKGAGEIDAVMKAGSDDIAVEQWADQVLKSGELISLSVNPA